MVRVRIAPSPTGFLHIGTARTALFNFLYARKYGGVFVLRIEDTDLERSEMQYEEDIIKGLQWLGLSWDEGPDVGGPHGPYRQSERLDIYRRYLDQLHAAGHIYECFCTEEELEHEREEMLWAKRPPIYSGKCRNLSSEVIAEKKEQGVRFTLRFKVEPTKLSVEDLIRGTIEFDTSLIGDFVIAKDFNAPLYNFAVVVDDYTMKISQVIRGEDHISNIPKQVLLDRALGFAVPQFAHLPLILNEDRTKLSKRQNKVSLLEYRTEGYLPEALINFMVFLGWNPGSADELFSLQELQAIFVIDQVNKSGAVFNLAKLDWFNAHHIKHADLDRLLALIIPYLVDGGFLMWPEDDILTTKYFTMAKTGQAISRDYLKAMIALERSRIKKLSEIIEQIDYYFIPPIFDPKLLCWKEMSLDAVRESLTLCQTVLKDMVEHDMTVSQLEEVIKAAIITAGKSNGEVLWPLRVALTGLERSPSPFEVVAVLGKEETLRRIDAALGNV